MLVPALLLVTLTLGALVLVSRRKARPTAPAHPTPRAEYLPAPHFGPDPPAPAGARSRPRLPVRGPGPECGARPAGPARPPLRRGGPPPVPRGLRRSTQFPRRPAQPPGVGRPARTGPVLDRPGRGPAGPEPARVRPRPVAAGRRRPRPAAGRGLRRRGRLVRRLRRVPPRPADARGAGRAAGPPRVHGGGPQGSHSGRGVRRGGVRRRRPPAVGELPGRGQPATGAGGGRGPAARPAVVPHPAGASATTRSAGRRSAGSTPS